MNPITLKTSSSASFSSVLMMGLVTSPFSLLSAIEPPPDHSKPPAALFREIEVERDAAAKLPFIGLSTASVPDVVADHLSLSEGSGVIIRTVCPDSPAEKAGLSVNDIILSLDGKPVANPEEFSERIRSCKVGDIVELNLIQKGKPDRVKVTLTKRPEELNAHLSTQPFPQGAPESDQLRDMIERNMQGLGMEGLGFSPNGDLENTFRMMRERMSKGFDREIPPITQGEDGGVHFQQNSTIRLMDNEGSVEIKSSKGGTQVTVKDTAHGVVWQGPWNTEKDKKAAPQDIRERIDRVNAGSANGKGFTFRFGEFGGKSDTIDN